MLSRGLVLCKRFQSLYTVSVLCLNSNQPLCSIFFIMFETTPVNTASITSPCWRHFPASLFRFQISPFIEAIQAFHFNWVHSGVLSNHFSYFRWRTLFLWQSASKQRICTFLYCFSNWVLTSIIIYTVISGFRSHLRKHIYKLFSNPLTSQNITLFQPLCFNELFFHASFQQYFFTVSLLY